MFKRIKIICFYFILKADDNLYKWFVLYSTRLALYKNFSATFTCTLFQWIGGYLGFWTDVFKLELSSRLIEPEL